MAAKIIVLVIIAVIGFFIIRKYHRKRKALPGEKPDKKATVFEIIGCLFEARLEGLF